MSTMQIFHNQLFHALEVHDPNLDCLAQLTRTNPAQIRTSLQSGLQWVEWGAESSGASAPTTE